MFFDLFLIFLINRINCGCEGLDSDECKANPNCQYLPEPLNQRCVNIPCDVRCLTCDNDNRSLCLSCKNGYYLDKNDESLTYQRCVRNDVQCDTKCEACDSYGSCIKCKLGYGKAKNGTCQKCIKDHCFDCGFDYELCSDCEVGYGYDTDKFSDTYHECIKCESPNCESCKSSEECTVCTDYHGMDKDKNSQTYGQCIQCKDRYCDVCQEDADECFSCKEGYGVDYSNRDNPTFKTCIPCNDLNCINCGLNANNCDECKEGYTFYNKKCLEIKCNEHCEDCSTDENTCNRCQIGYGRKWFSSDNGIPECIKCSNEDIDLCYDAKQFIDDYCLCFKCIDGYYVGSFDEWDPRWGKCYKCDVPNCKKCDTHSSYCDECMDGFGLDIFVNTENYGKCIPCQKENCKSCSTQYTQCDICKDGFDFDNDGSCVQNKDENDPNDGNNDGNDDGNSGGKGKGMSKTTLIIIIVVVAVVVVALVVFLSVFLVLRKKRKNLEKSSNEGNVENN